MLLDLYYMLSIDEISNRQSISPFDPKTYIRIVSIKTGKQQQCSPQQIACTVADKFLLGSAFIYC